MYEENDIHESEGHCYDEPVFDVIVTRHAALVRYLSALGLSGPETKVISHATPDQIRDRHVAGVLPHSLSCLTASFTEVPLFLPPELRGKELTYEQVKEFAGEPATYIVNRSE